MSLIKSTHFHVRIQHWVLVWFYVGIACGAIALINILFRDLSPADIRLALVFGVLNWALLGVVCYCLDGVKIEKPPRPPGKTADAASEPPKEWHAASDFLLPGSRKSILPPKY
jgi:predicted membrane channel-forming protein YqfA (hemolysin III family)